MKISIGKYEFTQVWDGVLYKNLSSYPNITPWELRTILEFMEYERTQGRDCEIECDESDVLEAIARAQNAPRQYLDAPRPKLLTECTACLHRGCVTEFVCHTTSAENAAKIFQCGKLLSAVKARAMPAQELMKEARNAAGDPEDYFDYVMLSWGNCQAGDRLVMERKLKRFPNETDLSVDFTPGVRFYFCYDVLATHPGRVFDGVLPMKIKDEIALDDWLYAVVIPESLMPTLKSHIPPQLRQRVIRIAHAGENIWQWSQKVYRAIEELSLRK